MTYDMTILIQKIVGKTQYFTVNKNPEDMEFFYKNIENTKRNASHLCFLLSYLSIRANKPLVLS